ncbi:MAG: hypothetical protein WC829_03375 [Hyphomicrobium sp.]|jgi:hypothetical protein
MKALFESLVRTYVPWLAGVIIGWLISLGVPLDPDVEVQVTLALMGVASILYYFLARVFEIWVKPKFGWLLGLAKSPTYDDETRRAAG